LHLTLAGQTEIIEELRRTVLSGKNFTVARAALEIRRADHPSTFYGVTLSLSPDLLYRLAELIPYLGVVVKVARLASGFLKDPKGTIESARYAPEALYRMFKHMDVMIDNFDSKAVLAAMMTDGTVKDAALAGRAYDVLLSKGIELKANKNAGVPTHEDLKWLTPEYIAWLEQQDPAALKKSQELWKEIKAQGLDQDLDAQPSVPTANLDTKVLETKKKALEKGFKDYVTAMDKAEATGDDAAVDKAQKALLETVDKYQVHRRRRHGLSPRRAIGKMTLIPSCAAKSFAKAVALFTVRRHYEFCGLITAAACNQELAMTCIPGRWIHRIDTTICRTHLGTDFAAPDYIL